MYAHVHIMHDCLTLSTYGLLRHISPLPPPPPRTYIFVRSPRTHSSYRRKGRRHCWHFLALFGVSQFAAFDGKTSFEII